MPYLSIVGSDIQEWSTPYLPHSCILEPRNPSEVDVREQLALARNLHHRERRCSLQTSG